MQRVPLEDLPDNVTYQSNSIVPANDLPNIVPANDLPNDFQSKEYEGWEADARGYGSEIGTSDVGHLARMAKSKFPQMLDGIRYKSKLIDGEEVYFSNLNQPMDKAVAERQNRRYDEFQALETYDERREYLKQQNLDDAAENYPNLTEEMKDSGQALIGEIGGSLVSPTTLIAGPVALLSKGSLAVKAAKFGAMSGLFGGTYSAAQQASDEGSIDPARLAKDTALATVGGTVLRGAAPLVLKGVQKAGNVAAKGATKVINKTEESIGKLVLKSKADVSAVEFMDEINVQAAKIIRNNGGRDYMDKAGVFTSSGVVNQKVLTKLIKNDLIKEAKLTPEQFKIMEREAGIQFKVPTNQTEALERIGQTRFDKYTNPEKNPFKHKVLQLISEKAVITGRNVETLITPTYEKLKAFAPEIAAKMMRMDFNILTKANRLDRDVKVFREQVKSLSKDNKNLLKKSLSDGDFSAAESLLGNDVGFSNVRKVLERLRTESIKAGIKIDKVEDYFPRVIPKKNRQRYLDRINAKLASQNSKKVLTEYNSVIKDLKKKVIIKRGEKAQPTAEEKTNALNQYLQGGAKRKPSRVMLRIDMDLIDEYLDPMEALEAYMTNSIHKTEKAKFLGRHLRLDNEGKSTGNDFLDESIAAISDDIQYGNRQEELQKILKARLINGEQGSGWMQPLKNISYITLLGNPSSAIVQGGDIGFSAAQSGMYRSTKNLLKQMGRQKFGDKLAYSIDEIGLGRTVSAEMGGTQKGLDKAVSDLFDLSQFTRVDRVGKTTSINSSLEKAMDVVKLNKKGTLSNPKQYQQFKNEWEGILGKDGFVNMVAAMRTGRKTDDVGFYLFSELSKVQPISLSQMPVAYLNAKNGKIFYTLKSFALKQLDFARRKIVTELARGEYKSAFKNTLVLSATLGGAQTTTKQLQKLIVGSPEEIKIEDMPDEFVETLAKGLFISKYSREKLAETGDVLGYIYDNTLPAVSPLFDIGRDVYDYMDTPETAEEIMRSVTNPKVPFKRSRKFIPVGGRTYDEQTVKKPKRRQEELRELMRGLSLDE